jgi:hypothetical protein
METLQNPEKTGKLMVRDEKGRIVKGQTLNPLGKPVGARHMTTIIFDALSKVAKDTGTREDVEIVKTLLRKAKEGDTKAIEMIMDRTDGKPVQMIDQRVQNIPLVSPEQEERLKKLLENA